MCTGERNLYAHRKIISTVRCYYEFHLFITTEYAMNNIIYLVGLIVIVIAILKFSGIV